MKLFSVCNLSNLFCKLANQSLQNSSINSDLKPTHHNWGKPSAFNEMEKILLNYNIIPISSGGGNLDSHLGSGYYTSAHEVMYDGKRMVAKITRTPHDAEQYRKVMELKASVPEIIGKHLPEVYKVIDVNANDAPPVLCRNEEWYEWYEHQPAFIILTEMLVPLNSHVKTSLQVFLGKMPKKHIPDIDFIISYFNSIDGLSESIFDQDAIKIIDDIKKFYDEHEHSGAADINFEELKNKLKLFIKDMRSDLINLCAHTAIDSIEDDRRPRSIEYSCYVKIAKFIISCLSGVVFDAVDRFDDFVLNTVVTNLSLKWKSRAAILDLMRFPEKHTQLDNKDKLKFFANREETKSLLRCLIYLSKKFNFNWKDVKIQNLMERPSTREIVISDVGEFNKQY